FSGRVFPLGSPQRNRRVAIEIFINLPGLNKHVPQYLHRTLPCPVYDTAPRSPRQSAPSAMDVEGFGRTAYLACSVVRETYERLFGASLLQAATAAALKTP